MGSDGRAGSGRVLGWEIAVRKIVRGRIGDGTVANFGGRVDVREAQLCCGRKICRRRCGGVGTVDAKEFSRKVREQEVEDLKSVVAVRRVDAGQPWIDIRLRRITYPVAAVVVRWNPSENG